MRVLEERQQAERRPAGAARDVRHAVGEQVGSPRKRLTMKPTIIAASAGSITACVPTRLAITPPRSMSPSSTTGTSAARAKPMLAMSAARRFTSDAEPAPSTSTGPLRPRDAEALQHGAEQLGLHRLVLARLGGADDLALDHDLRADVALGLQQHRVHVTLAGTLAARACSAWARPISPPSAGDGGIVRHVLRLDGRTRGHAA
jgi:hypothetical protein